MEQVHTKVFFDSISLIKGKALPSNINRILILGGIAVVSVILTLIYTFNNIDTMEIE